MLHTFHLAESSYFISDFDPKFVVKIGPLSDAHTHTRRAHQRKIRTSVGCGARTFGGISFPPRLVTILLTCVCVCAFFLVQNSSRRLTMRAFDRASLSPGSTVCDAIVGRESTAKKQKKACLLPLTTFVCMLAYACGAIAKHACHIRFRSSFFLFCFLSLGLSFARASRAVAEPYSSILSLPSRARGGMGCCFILLCSPEEEKPLSPITYTLRDARVT